MRWGVGTASYGAIRGFAAVALVIAVIGAAFGMQAGDARASGLAVTATLTAPSTAEMGQPMNVSWETSSPTSYDWVAAYRVGAPDSDYTVLGWFYTSTCTHSSGPAKASGSCSLSLPLSVSVDYEFRFFRNGGFTRLATSSPVHVVDTTAPTFKTISASPVATSGPTAQEVISWTTYEFADSQVDYGLTDSYGSSTTLDSLKSTIHKQYLTGLAFNTLYHYRVKSRDASGNLGVSAGGTFTTGSGSGSGSSAPTLTASPSSLVAGASTTVAWDHVNSPTTSDWIGLYKAGAADTAFSKWFYTGTCAMVTSSTQSVSSSCSVTVPTTPGTYEFRLFTNNGYTRLATSPAVTVTAPTSAGSTLTATPATATKGSSINVGWQGVTSPTSLDWVGLYKTGAADTAISAWFYTATCTYSPGTAKGSGSCSVKLPATAGTYEVRLFKNGGFTRLATSGPITVTAT